MRAELLELLADLPIATVMVTHDQEEAMAIADRIVVMRAGNIEQIGTPGEVYERPASLFAARFIGDTNSIPGRVSGVNGDRTEIAVGNGAVVHARGPSVAPGTEVQVLVRPQRMWLSVTAESRSGGALPVTVERVLFLGHRTECHVRTMAGHPLIIWLDAEASAEIRLGSEAVATWDIGATVLFPAAA